MSLLKSKVKSRPLEHIWIHYISDGPFAYGVGIGLHRRVKRMTVEWMDYELKERVCEECGCNLIITRKYRFFKHRRGQSFFFCIDCETECKIKWVTITDAPYNSGCTTKIESTRFSKLLSRIEHLRGVLFRKSEWIDNLLLNSLNN